MTYAQRQINLQFSDNSQTLSLEGLRVQALVLNPGGLNAFGQIQLRAYGMSLQQMNQFSSTGANMIAVQNRKLTVSAGDVGAPVTQVFSGTLVRSFIDFAQAPDVAFVCSGIAGYYNKATAAPPNTFKGSHSAEDIINALASSAGLIFVNNGAHAVLQNQYTYGSLIDQIQTVARAAGFPMSIENDTVTIWPNDGFRDNTVIDIGPDTGMVGYPTYYEAGFIVKSEFSPRILTGRQVRVTSSIPKANGTWPVQNMTHELSTQEPGGPWFTTCMLAPAPYVPTN